MKFLKAPFFGSIPLLLASCAITGEPPQEYSGESISEPALRPGSYRLTSSTTLSREPGVGELFVAERGTPVKLLATDGTHARVELANGDSGWLSSKYLASTRPAFVEPEPVRKVEREEAPVRKTTVKKTPVKPKRTVAKKPSTPAPAPREKPAPAVTESAPTPVPAPKPEPVVVPKLVEPEVPAELPPVSAPQMRLDTDLAPE